MREETIKLLEDRVFEAVARIRDLRSELEREVEERSILRARLEEIEFGGIQARLQGWERDLDKIRAALRDAIRDLREEDPEEIGPSDRGDSGRTA